MSASQITAFNQNAIPSTEQAIVYSWIAKYFDSIFDEVSAKNCMRISENITRQVIQQEANP